MTITAECILADDFSSEINFTKIDILVDLDHVETLSDVFHYVNNESEAQNSYVKRIKMRMNLKQKVMNKINCSNYVKHLR